MNLITICAFEAMVYLYKPTGRPQEWFHRPCTEGHQNLDPSRQVMDTYGDRLPISYRYLSVLKHSTSNAIQYIQTSPIHYIT